MIFLLSISFSSVRGFSTSSEVCLVINYNLRLVRLFIDLYTMSRTIHSWFTVLCALKSGFRAGKNIINVKRSG